MDDKSVFATLSAINCNGHTETKNGLTYLSWAWAWQIVKENYPSAYFTVYETPEGRPYFDDGRTCWVKTGVTIEGLEHIEYLPIMDNRNNSIALDRVTSMDMNKSIQRSLTKACARHGLGLYIYAGEDLPAAVDDADAAQEPAPKKAAVRKAPAAPAPKPAPAPDSAPSGYKPIPEGEYWKVIGAWCRGIVSKSGQDYRTAWIEATNAGPDEIAKFNHDAENWRGAHPYSI